MKKTRKITTGELLAFISIGGIILASMLVKINF